MFGLGLSPTKVRGPFSYFNTQDYSNSTAGKGRGEGEYTEELQLRDTEARKGNDYRALSPKTALLRPPQDKERHRTDPH